VNMGAGHQAQRSRLAPLQSAAARDVQQGDQLGRVVPAEAPRVCSGGAQT